MGDMRRAALVIGCSDWDLHARITSNRSYGGGVRICRGWRSIRCPSITVAARGRRDGENGSCSNEAIATMAWEHGDCLSMNPADRTFNLVIDKGDLDCVMCSSDQIDMRMNTYRDKLGRVLSLVDLEDEDSYSYNNEGG